MQRPAPSADNITPLAEITSACGNKSIKIDLHMDEDRNPKNLHISVPGNDTMILPLPDKEGRYAWDGTSFKPINEYASLNIPCITVNIDGDNVDFFLHRYPIQPIPKSCFNNSRNYDLISDTIESIQWHVSVNTLRTLLESEIQGIAVPPSRDQGAGSRVNTSAFTSVTDFAQDAANSALQVLGSVANAMSTRRPGDYQAMLDDRNSVGGPDR